MQIGTFQGFASIPSGDSWSSGAAVGQRIGEAAMQYDIDRQKLATQMAIANMEAAAKSAALHAESTKAAQELEVRKAYQQAQIGLQSRELDMKQAIDQQKAEYAAREFMAQQQVQGRAAELMQSGVSPSEALSRAAAQFPTGVDPSVLSSVVRGGGQQESALAKIPFGVQVPVKDESGKESEELSYIRTGPESISIQKKGQAQVPYEERFSDRIDMKKYDNLVEERKALRNKMGSDMWAAKRKAAQSEADGVELTKAQKANLAEYRQAEAQLQKLDEMIASAEGQLGKRGQSQFPAATLPQGGSTNRIGRFNVISR